MKKNYLEHKGFIGSVEFSTEDEVFYGKIEDISGLVSFEVSSVKELKKSFEETVTHYVKICKEQDKPIVKSLKGYFNVRIKPELHRQAYTVSLTRGISLNQFVQKAIENELAD